MLKFDFKTFNRVVDDSNYQKQIHDIRNIFDKKKDMLGWYDVETCVSDKELEKIKKVSSYIRKNSDILIVIGTGSAYMGSKAVIDAISPSFDRNDIEIIYAGNDLSADHLREILQYVQDKEIALNVISSSGNTIETNLIFDVFYDLMEAKYGSKELKKRVIITTDLKNGRLRKLVKENNFVSFPTKKNITEGYSILTTIGLLPMAVKGINIDRLIEGYKNGKKYLDKAYVYAVMRDILYHQGRKVESLTVYEPKLVGIIEWIKQLFAQTHGKNNAGILPMTTFNTRDLYSIGQYIEQGDTIVFETVLAVAHNNDININDKSLSKINHLAMLNVAKSHRNHTPSNIITVSKLNEKTIGELTYFFLATASIGGYLMGINPFDESGMNKYKKLLIESIGEL